MENSDGVHYFPLPDYQNVQNQTKLWNVECFQIFTMECELLVHILHPAKLRLKNT